MNSYKLDNVILDSIDLKCLVVSKGIKVNKKVYDRFSDICRVNINPLMCNCFFLSDGTYIQLTDVKFHLRYLTGVLSWDNIKLLKYASELGTPFNMKLTDDKPALFYNDTFIDYVSFPPKNDFYKQKTSSSLPFVGNSVLQGCDWVAFQCLWPCEYAANGEPCQFCFSGDIFQTLAEKSKPLPRPVKPSDIAEIVGYAVKEAGCNSIQITGGSTFEDSVESAFIIDYLNAVNEKTGIKNITGEILLYITPSKDYTILDRYFELGASRIACSIEVWDEEKAKFITPGKIKFTTRKRYLEAMEYTVKKYGTGKAFSNLIIGLEELDTLKEGVYYLAQRGIIPSASVWMPMGRPVLGSMKAPDVDYYKRVKELYAEVYQKYNLDPAGGHGLNVCIERDIWRYMKNL